MRTDNSHNKGAWIMSRFFVRKLNMFTSDYDAQGELTAAGKDKVKKSITPVHLKMWETNMILLHGTMMDGQTMLFMSSCTM